MSSPPDFQLICIHGLEGHALLMSQLERRVRKFCIRSWVYKYPAKKRSLETHIEDFIFFLQNEVDTCKPLLIVGHSMGGIIALGALNSFAFRSRCILLQLGPPNQGSSMARFILERSQRLSKYLGPALPDLANLSELPAPNGLKILALIGTLPHIGWLPLLEGENDGIVTYKESLHSGHVKTYRCLSPHFFLPLSPTCTAITKSLLQN